MVQKAEAKDTQQAEATGDGPLLDLSDSAVKRMIKSAKARGYVTYDELNEVLPSEEVTSEQIEDIMAMLSEMGINVVENEEEEDDEEALKRLPNPRAANSSPRTSADKGATKSEPSDRTDDPVRMYLREMGSVELLSREGEIAIAKRIEAGHEAMIAGLCESPLTFQAIIIWRDELNEGTRPPARHHRPRSHLRRPGGQGCCQAAGCERLRFGRRSRWRCRRRKPTAPSWPSRRRQNDASDDDDDDDDDDDYENALSLAAMEAELKPKVLETFDRIASELQETAQAARQDDRAAGRRRNRLAPAAARL
jgi:RNA polymerase primary sigma factor